MDKIFLIVGFAAVSGIIAFTVRQSAPVFAVVISVCASAAVLLYVSDDFYSVVSAIKALAEKAELNSDALESIVKITAVSFAGQWGAGICRDVGEGSLAEKTELAVKLIIILISIPYIEKLFLLVEEI